MCEFCDVLTAEKYDKEIIWGVRSTFADDNIEEILESRSYTERWIEDYSGFKLYGHVHEGNTFVGVEYRKEISNHTDEKAVISPFSETIQFNFCPICGKQISSKIKGFKDYYYGQISIEDALK